MQFHLEIITGDKTDRDTSEGHKVEERINCKTTTEICQSMRHQCTSKNDKYILNDRVKLFIRNFLCLAVICNSFIAPSVAQIIVRFRTIPSLVNNELGKNVEGRMRGQI